MTRSRATHDIESHDFVMQAFETLRKLPIL